MGWYQHIKGEENEYKLASIVSQYTDKVYNNIRLPTMLTKSRYTELDVVAIVGSTVIIFETKSVNGITGNYRDRIWKMVGTSSTFTTLNTFIQNKLHSRVFKDIYFKVYGEYCSVISVMTVPSDTLIEGDISKYIVPFSSIGELLLSINDSTDHIITNRLIALIEGVRTK